MGLPAISKDVRINSVFALALFSMVTVFGFIGLLSLYSLPRGAWPADSSAIVFRDGAPAGETVLPRLFCATDKEGFIPGFYRFAFNLEVEDPKTLSSPALVFPLIGGNSLSVEFNGIPLGGRGDPIHGDASILNGVHWFRVSPELVHKSNQVDVDIRGVYEAGIMLPPYLADARASAWRLSALTFFTDYAVWISMGIALVMGAIIISAGLLSRSGFNVRILVGISCFTVAVVLLEYATLDNLPIPFLAFKKLVVSFKHLGGGLLFIAFLILMKRKLTPFAKVLAALQFLSTVSIWLYPGDAPGLKVFYGWTYLASIPLFPYMLLAFISVIWNSRTDKGQAILGFGIAVAFVAFALDIYHVTFQSSSPFIAHYGLIALLICAAAFIVRDMLSQYRSLVLERVRSAMFQQESMRDPLTGAFNRNILPSIPEGLPESYAVVYVDLDDFKSVNDNWGHAAGDAVLKRVADTMRLRLRGKDYVVRQGGDEFLAILPDCPLPKALELANSIVADVGAARFGCSDEASAPAVRCTVSVGIAAGGSIAGMEGMEDAISRADAASYQAKRGGKNRAVLEGRASVAPGS